MSNEYRGEGNVMRWTNNLTAGSGTVTKGSLVHLGNGKFGVAVDAIAFGATGNVIVEGEFTGGSAIIATSATVGAQMYNSAADIMAVTTLIPQSVNLALTSTVTIQSSNLWLTSDITGDGSAQAFNYKLTG